MKQCEKASVRIPTNDNAPIRGTAENMIQSESVSHLYVGNDVCLPTSEAPRGSSARKIGTWFTVTTNWPERLPILPEEIALIRGYMGDLVSHILANDNEPT